MAYLTLFLPGRPEPDGRIEALTADDYLIGRERDNHLIVLDSRVSRHHARVTREGEGFYIIDNGSSNGTLVNNQRVTRHLLQEGDSIQVGDSTLVFSGAPAPPAPGRPLPLAPDAAGVAGRITVPHATPPPLDPADTIPQPPPPPAAAPRQNFCVNCGQPMDAADRFCMGCGFAAFPG